MGTSGYVGSIGFKVNLGEATKLDSNVREGRAGKGKGLYAIYMHLLGS